MGLLKAVAFENCSYVSSRVRLGSNHFGSNPRGPNASPKNTDEHMREDVALRGRIGRV